MKFSLIIINFNKEDAIVDAVKSGLDQTYEDVEVICVDDCSTDNSVANLKKNFENDKRFKLVVHEKNQSAYMSRISGIEAATGDYCIFLDGDDVFRTDGIAKLYNVLKEKEYDIVGFALKVVECIEVHPVEIEYVKKYLRPLPGEATGEEMFYATYVDRIYNYAMISKCYKTSILKESARRAEKFYSNYNEDYTFNLITHLLAKTYYGMDDYVANYSYGIGVSTSPFNSLPSAKVKINSSYVSNQASKKHLAMFGENEVYKNALRYHEVELLGDIFRIISNCPREDMKEAFLYTNEMFDSDLILERLMLNGLVDYYEMLSCIDFDMYYPDKKDNIKTVGIYCDDALRADYKEKANVLAEYLKSKGINVVDLSKDDSICKNVDPTDKKYYKKRYESFKKSIEDNDVDAVLYCAFYGLDLLRDMIAAKAAGSRFVVHSFGGVNTYDSTMLQYLLAYYKVYGCVDAVVSESAADSIYWNYAAKVLFTVDPDGSKDYLIDVFDVITGKKEPEKQEEIDIDSFMHKFKSMMEILLDKKNRIILDRENQLYVMLNAKSYKMTQKVVKLIKKVLRKQ